MPYRMLSNSKKRLDFINMLCRVCAKEDLNSIPIFGEDGRKHNLVKKIQACLPITICEEDVFPKQICLTCLTKLDSFWDMHVLCKEAQIKIENKFLALRNQDNFEQFRINPPIEEKLRALSESYPVSYGPSAVICLAHPPPPAAVTREAQPRLVESMMTPVNYIAPAHAASTAAPPSVTEDGYPQSLMQVTQNPASEQPVVYQNCSVAAASPAPHSAPGVSVLPVAPKREAHVLSHGRMVESLMTPLTYLTPAPAAHAATQPSVTEQVYPQSLIQVTQNPPSEQPVVYKNSVPAATPAPPSVPRRRAPIGPASRVSPAPPTTPSPRSMPIPLRRQNGETPNNEANDKKLCVYCNKYFTDDIIDHHVSLHLRQSFSSCVECGKNFRSEEAMQRHRCGDKKDNQTIDLDSDDDEPMMIE